VQRREPIRFWRKRDAGLVASLKRLDETGRDESGNAFSSPSDRLSVRFRLEKEKLDNRAEFEKAVTTTVRAEAEWVTSPLP